MTMIKTTKTNRRSLMTCTFYKKKLQSGSYGTVYITIQRSTNEEFAVKVIDRTKFKKPQKDTNAVHREVEVMRDLSGCDGIVHLENFFETPTTFHMVLELAAGGDLFDKLGTLTVYTEFDARNVAKQLLETIKYMHDRNVVHRDLKPENLLLKQESSNVDIKLGDFGFATHVPPDGFLTTRCGTPAFVAPEILLGQPYGKSVDMWSTGVIFYMLLGGYAPFQDKHHRELFQKIRSADFTFHEKYWSQVSIEAKKLINGLLTVNPAFRLDVDMALQSDWITDATEEDLSGRDLSASIKLIQEYPTSPNQKLKGAVHAITWAVKAKFWDNNAVTFATENKYDSLFSESSGEGSTMATTTKKPRPSKESKLTSTSSKNVSGAHRIHFRDVYELKKKIRKGSMATVWECVNRNTGETYAVKIIKREGLSPEDDEDVMNEVAVLQSLKHHNIVQLVDFYEETDYFYMVMEYMEGGDVFDRIVERSHYTEKDARDLIHTLLKTVSYIHSHGVAHRDLKPQNILLKSLDSDADIKLADFGFAKRVHTPQCLTSRCGTPTYVAPEILKNVPHDQAVDMWSIGVIAYVLLSGYPPFKGDNQADLFRQIRTGQYKFHEEEWTEISSEAKSLIRGLLQVDPNQRLTADEALEKKWFYSDEDVLSSTELSMSNRDLKETRRKFIGLAGAMRWLTMSKNAKPVSVEKIAPIADKEADEISQRELV